jgi:hypothetical protein
LNLKKINLVNKKIVLFFQRLRFITGHNFTQPSLVLFLFSSPPPPSSSSIETEEERKRKKERKKGICIYGNFHMGGWGILASGTKRLSKKYPNSIFFDDVVRQRFCIPLHLATHASRQRSLRAGPDGAAA